MRPPDSVEIAKPTEKPQVVSWIPERLDLERRLRSELTPPQLFDRVNPSVWTVFSAATAENLKAMNNVSLASAVAVSETKLLTNHHVIDNKPYVVIKHGDRFAKAVVYSGDKFSDRCILLVSGVKLSPVGGYRRFSTLSVGEDVYTVGSPKGLENTLGHGMISAKRQFEGFNMIQTTAQISEGSSGGALFDHFGNLIGITTFKVIQGEGLNFAISIEDYTR
jgi:S1-C subfamily serine protease